MGTPFLDIDKEIVFVKTGFLPAGFDPCNELGVSVGMDKAGNVYFICPEKENHHEPVSADLWPKIQWNN